MAKCDVSYKMVNAIFIAEWLFLGTYLLLNDNSYGHFIALQTAHIVEHTYILSLQMSWFAMKLNYGTLDWYIQVVWC